MNETTEQPSKFEPGDSSRSSNCSSDIHSDGTVELMQRWQPGGAQGNAEQLFEDGEAYLFAVRIAESSRHPARWEIWTVIARGDSESPITFDTADGEPWDAWDWDSVEWFIPCSDIDLPYVE